MERAGKIAIIGTGLVGGGWAIVFARAGFDVMLFDREPGAVDRARTRIEVSLGDLAAHGLVTEPEAVLARIAPAPSLGAALDGAIYAQESIFEQAEAKRAMLSEIDAVIGAETILGSSSSGIPASVFTGHVGCRARCLIAHPVNPPYLAPIVELVPAPWTAPETVRAARALMERSGQVPVEMAREAEGFLLNRLQAVLLMEAWRLVDEGLASADDIDKTVKHGLGLRWSFMGPFETIDLNAPGGIADYARRFGPLFHRIAAATPSHAVWGETLIAKIEAQRREVLPESALGARSVWRDRRLMALARHQRAEPGEA